MAGEASEDAHRARYYDWCSAKVAARFLSLSPEEVWQRATLAREAPNPIGLSDEERGLFVAANPFELIRLLSQELAAELQLPPFEEWMEEYGEDPERFEREIFTVSEAPASEPDSVQPSG